VVSGINRGVNLGTDLVYSGTAAAARQASLLGVPGIALSLEGRDSFYWDMASSWAADHLDELIGYWRKDGFVNVNIPNILTGPKGIKAAWPSVKDYHDKLFPVATPDGKRSFILKTGEEEVEKEEGSDFDVVSGNYVSISTLYNYPAVYRDLCPGAPDYAAVAMRGG